MGDRVSISFIDGQEESVALFSHWQGMGFVKEAQEFVDQLAEERQGKVWSPLDRLEPSTVMVDFIRYLTRDGERVESDLYLGKNGDCGDNGDNGHFLIDLNKKREKYATKKKNP